MQSKELIIQLIQQDMKHQQLVEYICKAGFETDLHGLDLLHIVAALMGITGEIPERWTEIYMDCLGNTVHYPIAGSSQAFRALAEECYMLLSHS